MTANVIEVPSGPWHMKNTWQIAIITTYYF